MKTILITILIFLYASCYAQVDGTTFKDNNGVTIEIQSYKYDKIESKVTAVTFWVKYTNNSSKTVDEFWNNMYLKASDGKYVEPFFTSPTMGTSLKPLENATGVVMYKSERVVENAAFFISSKADQEPTIEFKKIKEQSNTQLYDDYKVATLKIRFDMDSFGDPQVQLFNSIKPDFDDMNHYFYNHFLLKRSN